ncbi:hypothetical protein MMC17_000342 [Xylographa soralifera]|nr:hypothetical protein [Xylographa soralifera]
MAFSLIGSFGVADAIVSAGLCYLIYSLGVAVYNITLHPLAKLPGPKVRGAFYLPSFWEIYTGDTARNWKTLHDAYGDVVRISPTTLSFNSQDAWQDIYSQRSGKKPIPKDAHIYFSGNDGVADIISANDMDHARIRRLLSHAFSEAALREQEPLLNSYFDLLVQKLYSRSQEANNSVDISRYYNFTTFDLIGDLCFGESFGALENEDYNFWIAQIFKGIKFVRMFRVFRAYPVIGVPFFALLSLFPRFAEARTKHVQYTRDKTSRRLDTETDRHDFMRLVILYILRHNDEKGMSRAEIMKTSGTLIIAGSETTATLLSGVTFHLLDNPAVLRRLVDEVRGRFLSPQDMTFLSLAQLPYLTACLQEALRIYPPIPGTLPRRTLPGGALIAGHFIPEDVSVGVHQWSATHSSRNFMEPDEYIPERWLGSIEYASDVRSAAQPFSVGPRNCIGQHLAMAEMRAIIARIIWHFDMELSEDSQNWADQKVYIFWEKPPLNVKLVAKRST